MQTVDNPVMPQHPKVTLSWAMEGLENAIGNLPEGPKERRVRAQFHQLLLALERTRLLNDSLRPSSPVLPDPVRSRSIHARHP